MPNRRFAFTKQIDADPMQRADPGELCDRAVNPRPGEQGTVVDEMKKKRRPGNRSTRYHKMGC